MGAAGPPRGFSNACRRAAHSCRFSGVAGLLHVPKPQPLAQRIVTAITQRRRVLQRWEAVAECPSEAVRDHHGVAAVEFRRARTVRGRRALSAPVPHRHGCVVFARYRAIVPGSVSAAALQQHERRLTEPGIPHHPVLISKHRPRWLGFGGTG